MKNFTKTALCAMLMLLTASAYAQGVKIFGKLLDATTGETLPYATISLTPEGSQKAVKYVLTTSEGGIMIESVRPGSYTIKAELMGYKALTKAVKVESANIRLGELKMNPDNQMLEAAKVSSVGNPIVVKKDTIEYNAAIVKTSDNDMLIDLLKKLPGIEVDTDGKITANGKEIKKITIDGKTFFLDDPQLATKNIPSKIIDKVKVVDKKSDQAMFTGIDDGEEETIIDLGIKKGMFKGWFGNVMGGGGHDVPSPQNSMNDWRYQGAGFIGNFTDNQQISIILNGNNTNNRGFNDLAGNMMGGMRGGRGGRGGGWGNNDGGITTSWMGGVNGAWTLLDNKMDLAGNYLYNGSIKDVNEDSFKSTYLNDNESLNYKTNSINRTFTNGHRIGMRLDHKFTENTSILFEPQFNIGNGNYNESSTFSTDKVFKDAPASPTHVNDGFSNNMGNNRNWNASGWGLLRQRLGKAGRTMTVNFRYNFSNNDMNGFNLSRTLAAEADPEIVNQRFVQNAKGNSVTAGITYTEPLYKEILFLEANYNYTWNNQNSYKNTYASGTFDPLANPLVFNPEGETLDPTFSNRINNTSHNHRAGANLMFQKKKFNAQLGFNANPTQTINETVSAGELKTYRNKVTNWAPQASLRYDANDNTNLRFNYWGRSNQPSTSQLMPVPDNSDPLNVSLGNPYLLPYFNHNMRGMFRYTNKKNFASVNAFLNGGIVENPIVNTSWYESDGRQFSLPKNGRNSYNVGGRVMVNAPLGKKSNLTLFNMLRAEYNNSSNFLKTGNTLDMSRYYQDGQFDYDLFHNEVEQTSLWDDNFTSNTIQTLTFVERLRLTYRLDFVEINAGARTRMNRSWYTIAQGNTNTTWATQVEGTMNWTIPGGINLIAEYNYNRYDGYTTPQQDAHVLNAEITKLLCKNKLTLGIKGYDLLGQSRNLSVIDAANYHQETRNNTLGRYIIVSLTYRFGNLNKGRDSMMGGQRGPGGPMGGGRRW